MTMDRRGFVFGLSAPAYLLKWKLSLMLGGFSRSLLTSQGSHLNIVFGLCGFLDFLPGQGFILKIVKKKKNLIQL